MAIEKASQLFEFIQKEEEHIDLSHLNRIDETTIACGDPLITSGAAWRIVGGVTFLYINNYLEKYISVREGKAGVLEAHLACGWMFTKGYTSYQRQNMVIVETREQVIQLNKRYGTNFEVPIPGHIGSAHPFMVGNATIIDDIIKD